MALLAVSACGGGGTYQGGVYRDREATYGIGELGRDWESIEIGDENDLAFRNESLGAIVQVNASCDPALDIPLEALTNHLLIGFTEREDVEPQSRIPLDEREALRTHVLAKLDGVPRELLLYVLKKDECVYDFALVAPPRSGGFERARPGFESMVAGFHAGARGH
ncbi:MAG: hypothetical protein H5U40_04510 [Polyangiaceae bacterium]|nr:hypothetical protein [Polyangiaceae bacterium]